MNVKLLAIVVLALTSMGASQTQPLSDHMKPAAWMIGDWQGMEQGTDGALKVLMTVSKADNGNVLFFHVKFEKGGKTFPKYEGMYYWSPAKNSIVMTQVNEQGNLAEGTYTPSGDNEADQLVRVTTSETTFELKSHYVIDKQSFHFVGQFRPAGKTEWVPAVDVVYKRVGDTK